MNYDVSHVLSAARKVLKPYADAGLIVEDGIAAFADLDHSRIPTVYVRVKLADGQGGPNLKNENRLRDQISDVMKSEGDVRNLALSFYRVNEDQTVSFGA